MVIYATRMLPQ